MTIIGQKGVPIKMEGSLTGGDGGEIPVAGFNVSNTVGSIPVCSVNIPIEFVDKLKSESDDGEPVIYTLKINGYIVFTGVFTGDGHEITGTSCSAQISLIHPAHLIDVGQIAVPGMHSSSSIDFSNLIMTIGGKSKDDGNAVFTSFYQEGENIIDSIKKGIATEILSRSSSTPGPGGDSGPSADASASAKAVSSISAVYGGKLNESISLLGDSIDEWLKNTVGNSLVGRVSCWDLMSSLFSALQIYMVCDCYTGTVYAIPDVTGMKPPAGNWITGYDHITAARASSAILRNVGQVTLFSSSITNTGTVDKAKGAAFISYPETKAGGTELGISIPPWLNPLAQLLPSDELIVAQTAYAKSVYFTEKNKMKSASISTPLAPLVMPGTMVKISPYSAMKALSGMKTGAIDRSYVGYLYQVTHHFDANAKQIYSVLSFRNYTTEEGAETSDEHPLYTDAICPQLL